MSYSDFQPGDLAVCVYTVGDVDKDNGRPWTTRAMFNPVKGGIYTVTRVEPCIRAKCDALVLAEIAATPDDGFNSRCFRRLLRKEEIEAARATAEDQNQTNSPKVCQQAKKTNICSEKLQG